jgi:signal transduction histidine kinase
LKGLVDNILQLSEPCDSIEWIDLREQIGFIQSLLAKKLADKSLCLKVSYCPELPEKIHMNTLKFQQILINLLNNAIKFSECGNIQVSVGMTESQLKILVSDPGIGIGRDAQAHIFDPFYREDRAEVKCQEGDGLGLALARKLARSLGGDLRLIASEMGKGTTFAFEIKFRV